MAAESTNEELVTAAYAALKAEQTSRISVRDNYGLTYAASLASLFFGFYTTKNAAVLLIVPPVAFIGLHAYATNDQRISAIREFLGSNLPSSIARNWETSHHEANLVVSTRSLLRTIVSLLLFAGPSIVSSVVIFTGHYNAAVRLASITVTCASLALMIITYAVLYMAPRIPHQLPRL